MIISTLRISVIYGLLKTAAIKTSPVNLAALIKHGDSA